MTTVAWLVLAIVYLAYGLARGSVAARAASGLLLAVTVGKVALFDLAGVTGIWRAASFLCLGAVLIGIGVVYQKWVLGRRHRHHRGRRCRHQTLDDFSRCAAAKHAAHGSARATTWSCRQE